MPVYDAKVCPNCNGSKQVAGGECAACRGTGVVPGPERGTTRLPHHCWLRSAEQGYGSAMDDCESERDGTFWVSNGEYASQVNFCPVCGAKAPTPVPDGKYGSA